MNPIPFFSALGVFLFCLVALAIWSRRIKTWYTVYLANNDVMQAYRTGWDKLWRSDEAGIMVFHSEEGRCIRISKHWIIKIEED